jgi:hypothetical protein
VLLAETTALLQAATESAHASTAPNRAFFMMFPFGGSLYLVYLKPCING